MASPSTPVHPARYLALFLVLLIGVYLLVFLTGNKQAKPKLGIDLQGGTRVTLTARTPDGSRPTRDALDQAQQIISARVNGLGVSGSEVVIDGDNLVITVPGNDSSEARNLGQTARLYIRPVIQAYPRPAGRPATGQPPAGRAARQDAARRHCRADAARAEPASAGAGLRPAPARRQSRGSPDRQQPGAGNACAPQPRPYPQAPPPTPAPPPPPGPAPAPPAKPDAAQRPRAAHRRPEGVAAEHRAADSVPGAADPGHAVQRGRHPGRQRRSEPAAGDLLDRPQAGVSAGQVDHQRRADQERQFRPGHAAR